LAGNIVNHYFAELGLDAEADERAVKRAYAARLKLIDVEKDPAAFQALRETFEGALWYARNAAYSAMEEAEEAELAADSESPTSAPITPATSQSQIEAVIAAVLTHAIAPSFQHTESASQPPIPKGWASLDSSAHDEYQFNFAVNIVRSTHAVDSREVAASMVTGARQKLASFAAQENFELDVARHIASETGYTAASILGIADAMGWHDDKLYSRDRLATLDANLAYQVEQKLFAARGLNYLHGLKDSRHAAGRTLMGKFRPAIFRLWIFDKDELAEFHHFIDEFRWADFSSFSNAPDPRVIDWWKEHGRAPRITLVKLSMATIAGVFAGSFAYDSFNMRNLALSSNALLALAILIDILIGFAVLAATIGVQHLWARYSIRYQHHFNEKTWLKFGWVSVAPIALAFTLLRPEMTYWEIPPVFCIAVFIWIKQIILKNWELQEIAFSAVFPGIPTAMWVQSFFAQPHFFSAYAAGLLALIYTLAVMREAQFILYGDTPSDLRFAFKYGWLALLGMSVMLVIGGPAATSIDQQAGRLLWLLSIIWGAAATSFYPARLKNGPWVGMVLLSIVLYVVYFAPPVTGMTGFAVALSATIITLIFFIINRIPPLNAWLQR
jgi:hypothetical protein